MRIRPLGSGVALESPGHLLRHFTDREPQKELLLRLFATPPGTSLPLLAIYGVGGIGKSFLGRRLVAELRGELTEANTLWFPKELYRPVAKLDFDPLTGQERFLHDSILALQELRHQLKVSCLRFDLALAWLRQKQGVASEPSLLRTDDDKLAGETVNELGSALLNDLPFANMIWFTTKQVGKRLLGTKLGERLTTKAGCEDFIALKSRPVEEFTYRFLLERLADDLHESLPKRTDSACRLVVVLDTFERIAMLSKGDADQYQRERWVRALYECLSPFTLIVVLGQNRLDWEQHDPDWSDPAVCEQHLLGGLSASDAGDFLLRCGVEDALLRTAFLAASQDASEPSLQAYHPFTLGLCADIAFAERESGRTMDPLEFQFAPGQLSELAERFLKVLPDEERLLVERLALVPRFDRVAVSACTALESAWQRLLEFSFVLPVAGEWYTLNARMRDVLLLRWKQRPEALEREHTAWQERWQSRSEGDLDVFASLSWYHLWCLKPGEAWPAWEDLSERERAALHMQAQLDLIDWWELTELETKGVASPEEANALNAIGIQLWRASLGNRSVNLSRAISCYEAVLHVYTEDIFPIQWATMQNNLGNIYADLPTGERDVNLSHAIACYEAALRVRTKDRFPMDWAMTQNNLGIAYRNLPSGNSDVNLSRAIACYKAALFVYTEDIYPMDWAMTQNNMGAAYSNLPSGDFGVNLSHAVSCYEAALRVYTEDDLPLQWAATQNNMGNVYQNLISGKRDENMRHAVSCYEAALRVYTEDSFPIEWAMTQNNIGMAYFCFPSGHRGTNLSYAIAYYKAALRVRTEASFPIDWAATQNNLGVAYSDLSSNDCDVDMSRAIACYEAALRVYTEDRFPMDWAMTQNNLGIAYRNLSSGDRNMNLSYAIAYYEAALRVRTEDNFPLAWAATQFNIALLENDRGDVKQAQEHMKKAQDKYLKCGAARDAEDAFSVLQKWSQEA